MRRCWLLVLLALCRSPTIQKSRSSQFALPQCPRWWLSPASPLTHHAKEFAFIKLYVVYNKYITYSSLLLISQAAVKTASGCFITRGEALEMMGAVAVTPASLNPAPKIVFSQSVAPLLHPMCIHFGTFCFYKPSSCPPPDQMQIRTCLDTSHWP